MNTVSNTFSRRAAAPAAALALLAGLGLAGCAGGDPSESSGDRPAKAASAVTVPLEVQRARNLLVNDDDPRGLHGAPASGGTAAGTENESQRAPASVTEPHGLRSDPTLTKPVQPPRRTVNDDDPRGLHDLTTNGW